GALWLCLPGCAAYLPVGEGNGWAKAGLCRGLDVVPVGALCLPGPDADNGQPVMPVGRGGVGVGPGRHSGPRAALGLVAALRQRLRARLTCQGSGCPGAGGGSGMDLPGT